MNVVCMCVCIYDLLHLSQQYLSFYCTHHKYFVRCIPIHIWTIFICNYFQSLSYLLLISVCLPCVLQSCYILSFSNFFADNDWFPVRREITPLCSFPAHWTTGYCFPVFSFPLTFFKGWWLLLITLTRFGKFPSVSNILSFVRGCAVLTCVCFTSVEVITWFSFSLWGKLLWFSIGEPFVIPRLKRACCWFISLFGYC